MVILFSLFCFFSAYNFYNEKKSKNHFKISFDNEKWVQENLTEKDKNNPNSIFAFVRLKHPYQGCCSDPYNLPKANKKSSVDELSKFADAVTIFCFEKIGNDIKDFSLEDANTSAVGNVAYIALHHSNQQIRQKCLESINVWKNQKSLFDKLNIFDMEFL